VNPASQKRDAGFELALENPLPVALPAAADIYFFGIDDKSASATRLLEAWNPSSRQAPGSPGMSPDHAQNLLNIQGHGLKMI
jgi:hypothetical protein